MPRIIYFLTFLLIGVLGLQGATITWTNSAGGAWNTASNWSPATVPGANDDVIINNLSSSTKTITNVPNITLNSITCSGSGFARLAAVSSGDIITVRNSLYIPPTYTLVVGDQGNRLVMTISVTCTGTLDGVLYYDAGTTNRIFTLNGKLIIPQTGGLYDPNPSSGSDFIITSTGTIVTSKIQGITTASVSGSSAINTNVAICFGGSYTYAAGASYEYNGTAGQLSGNGLTQNTVGNLTVNLSSGQTLTLSGNTTVSGNLTMTSGTVNLNSSTLTLGTSAAATGTLNRTAGFLYNGLFSRWFSTSTVAMPSNAGLFPMGTSQADYRPLWIGYTSALTSGGVISVTHTPTYPATYLSANHSDASWTSTVVGVSNSFWTVSTSGGISFNGTSGQIRYGGTGFGTNTLADLNASQRSSVTGSHSASTNANTTYEVNRINLSTAAITNTWYIGSRNLATSPLPITLKEFDAKTESDHVKIYWSTSSEKNNHYFVVEKSDDGKLFETLAIVDSKGDADTQQDYFVYDPDDETCYNYYRLKQVDYDGNYKTSKTIVICNEAEEFLINLFPNPTNGVVNFYTSNQTAITEIEIYNNHGVKVFESKDWVETTDLSAFSAGIYAVHFNTTNNTIVKKIFLNK